MKNWLWYVRLLFVAAAVLLTNHSGGAQSYSSGQNVSPAFEGWEKNADGSFNFLFGYMNRNWEEEIDVPLGPLNNIEPGGPDQGQPTRLLPRRNRFTFRVRVPADFGQRELIWTLTTQGKTEKAYATLRTDYFIDDLVMASETGALGAGSSSPEVRSNKRPVVSIQGATSRTAKVGQPVELVATVSDDGIPRRRGGGAPAGGAAAVLGRGRGGDTASSSAPPDASAAATASGIQAGRGREGAQANQVPAGGGGSGRGAYNPPGRITVGKATGLHLAWFVYRGSGNVSFDPVQAKTWEDTRAGANSPWAPLWQPPTLPSDNNWTVQVTFDQPGTYVLRARADDGGLLGDENLTVNVTR